MTNRPGGARRTRAQRDASLERDLLRGAGEIGAFLFGKPRGEREAANNRQRAYKAISRGSIPTFRLGGMIHARRSAILRHIEEQERRGERAA
jgi:hypothetical protein